MGAIVIENLKSLRENAKCTQIEVAVKLGITQGAISQWESGLCNPDYKYLPELARLYNCTLENLINAIQLNKSKGVRDGGTPD